MHFKSGDLVTATRVTISKGKKLTEDVTGYLVNGPVFGRVLCPETGRILEVVRNTIREPENTDWPLQLDLEVPHFKIGSFRVDGSLDLRMNYETGELDLRNDPDEDELDDEEKGNLDEIPFGKQEE